MNERIISVDRPSNDRLPIAVIYIYLNEAESIDAQLSTWEDVNQDALYAAIEGIIEGRKAEVSHATKH
jgi:hypothetical protein